MSDIYLEIKAERRFQDEKWGSKRKHNELQWLSILAEEFGEAAKIVTQSCVPPEFQNYYQPKLEKELIQTAAVCIAWIESMRRK